MIAVFRSRTQLFSFVNAFERMGGRATIVSTPQAVGVGCGLSASFDEGYFIKARTIASGRAGFVGFYRITREKRIVKIL